MGNGSEETRDDRRAGRVAHLLSSRIPWWRRSNCKYSRYYGYNNCRTTWTQIPTPVRNPEQERLDAIALQKEDAKWDAFCKPKFNADDFGVRRASYSARGCEFGRSE